VKRVKRLIGLFVCSGMGLVVMLVPVLGGCSTLSDRDGSPPGLSGPTTSPRELTARAAQNAMESAGGTLPSYESRVAAEQEALEAQARAIEDLRAKLAKEPGVFAYEWRLADLLWRRGEYDEAARMYVDIVGQHPEYVEDATVKSRVEIHADKTFTVLTPREMIRRQSEAQPLAIINESTFRTGRGSGRDLFAREQTYYAVTGQVLNRGEESLHGVQVYVNLYGFGNVVYDTTTVNIGRLNPGEIRAFSVRFNTYDDIENVYRHECVGTYQR